jgi:hypothetical protein
MNGNKNPRLKDEETVIEKITHENEPFRKTKKALETLLALQRPTTKAVAYSEWYLPLVVNWE